MKWIGCTVSLLALLATRDALAKEAPSAPAFDPPRTARVPAQAMVAGKDVAAQAEFSCTTGRGGALQAALILPVPEQVPAFPLDAFEGPGGIGETKSLAAWSPDGNAAMRVPSSISGWRGVDGDGFLLATSTPSNQASDLARVLQRWLESDAARLRLEVQAPRGGAKLEAGIAASEERARLVTALAPCLAVLREH